MAVLISRATGNFTDASTWEVINNTSYSNSESATVVVTTSYQNSSTFTPGAINITGVAIKLSVRTGTTGTITVALDQGGSTVTDTEIAIDTADLPVAATADLNGGWVFFKFTNTVSLAGATAYSLKVKTSSSTQVSLFATGGTNWSRALATDVTQSPVAGDDFIICGEYVNASTFNSFVVTMNETTTTDYGSGSSSNVTPALAISNGGSLIWGTSSATNYFLKVSGNIVIYSGGTYQQGGVGAQTPHDSRADLQIDCSSNVIFGITPRNLCNFITQGLPRTSGKVFDRCFLNTDEAVDSTSLGVTENTGWLNDDVIAVASTTRTNTQCEKGTLNGDAGASTLTVDGFAGVGGGLAFAHSGTAPTQAEVILLTRNVSIFGASASLQTFIDIKATANVNCDWTAFYWMGSATANKRGIDTACTTGTQTFDYCSFYDFAVLGSRGLNVLSTSGTGLSINNCVTYNIYDNHICITAVHSGSWVLNNIVCMLNVANQLINILDVGGTFTNISVIGSAAVGFLFYENGNLNTFNNITAHSNTSEGISTTGGIGNLDVVNSWRNNGVGINQVGQTNAACSLNISNSNFFGNGTLNVRILNGFLTLNNCTLNGDTTFATTNGIGSQGNQAFAEIYINSCTFGVSSGIKTIHSIGDINFAVSNGLFKLFLNNTLLSSTTDVVTPTILPLGSFISSQKHNQTTGLHKIWKKTGIIIVDTSVSYSGSHSMKMIPNTSTFKLESNGPFGGFKCPVSSGQSVTPTIYVSEDSAYTAGSGNFVRLIVKKNDALGISNDTVLDTATSASQYSGSHHWEALTGTTATVTDDGTLEFIVDCDGTTGSVYIDKLTVV